MLGLLKQPRGFSIFFLTEIWERYGFYITQTLIIFYLIGYFHLTDTASYAILGSFTALAYINPALGGYIADRYIGAKQAILWGAILIFLGYIVLTLVHSLSYVFVALAIIAIGTGMLKPNVSSLLGSLYETNDPRRHTGYTIFYMGISLGVILATSLGGYLQQELGWTLTFLIAALVVLIAWVTFFFGARFYQLVDPRGIEPSGMKYLQSLLLIVLAVVMNVIIIMHQVLALIAFSLSAVLSVLIILYEVRRSHDLAEKKRFKAYLVLAAILVFYWAIYFQLFFSMNLFIERVVNRNIFGVQVMPSFFVSIESLGLLVFSPILGMLWHACARVGRDISVPTKFASGIMVMSLAFGLLFMSPLFTNQQGLVMWEWLVVIYLIISVSELMLSPIGLAMVTELAPPRLAGLMMGIFFVTVGLGGKLAGILANCAAISPDIMDVHEMASVYHHAFSLYFVFCFVISLASLALVRFIKRLIVV